MHIREEINEGVAVVKLEGDLLDEQDTLTIQEKIMSLKVDGMTKVVFDLERVNRINSKGLSVLISSFKTMRDAGGDIRFASIDNHVGNIFLKTKLVQVFQTYETVGRALASYA